MSISAFVVWLGTFVKNVVLYAANILTAEYAPGIAVILLALLFIWKVLGLLNRSRQFCGAAASARQQISQTDGRSLSGEEIDDLSHFFSNWAGEKAGDRRRFGIAWGEFAETLVRWQNPDGATRIGNAVRPSGFFNLTDMGVSMTKFRAWPGIFVTIGLFLTFLGLIAALQQTEQALGDNPQEALGTLLTVASAKFIMSLMGLACSILFGFVLRGRIVAMDAALHGLCEEVERVLHFVSAEELARDQLETMRDQSQQTRDVITAMVAEINKPLREEIPRAISQGIADAMTPVVDKIGAAGTSGVGTMVQDLSDRFTKDVAGALGSVSERLAAAGSTLETLAGRMDQSSTRMGGEMEAAISRLATSVDHMRESAGAAATTTSAKLTESAETLFAGMRDALDQIKANTSENGIALDRAATSMTEAAGSFRAELAAAAEESRTRASEAMNVASADAAARVGAAGAAVTTSMGASLAAITQQAEALSTKIAGDLFTPLDNMRDALSAAADRAAKGAADMARFSDGAERGAASVQTAAGLMSETAQSLAGAAIPIRDTAERFEAAAREAAQSAHVNAQTMKAGAEAMVRSAQAALESAEKTLGTERSAIEMNLKAIEVALQRFEDVAGRFDDIDEKLGSAFGEYRQNVESSISNLKAQSNDIQGTFTRALDTLREVVDKAEVFASEQRGH